MSRYSEGDGTSSSPLAAAAPQLHDADDDAPALGPSYPPPDYYALAYPEVDGDGDGVAEEREMDYSNAMFDQSVPVEGAVLCHYARRLYSARH